MFIRNCIRNYTITDTNLLIAVRDNCSQNNGMMEQVKTQSTVSNKQC